MKKKLKFDLALISIFIFLIFFLIFLYINLEKSDLLEKKVIYAKVIVGEKYGFDINGTALTFGRVIPGAGSAVREIDLVNKYDRDVRVEVYSDGDIKDFLKISKDNFILISNESAKIKFSIYVPAKFELGTYDGNVTILIKRANS